MAFHHRRDPPGHLGLGLGLGVRKRQIGGAVPESAFGTMLYLFDTSVASTITEEGTGVSKWTDLINGYEAIQTTDANRPTFTTDGSNPALLFNGTTDFLRAAGLAITGTPQPTVFFVARSTDRTNDGYVLNTTSSGIGDRTQNLFLATAQIRSQTFTDGSSSLLTVTDSGDETGLRAMIARHVAGGPSVIELDTGATGSDAGVGANLVDNFDKLVFGRKESDTSYLSGYIMQVGAYAEVLDDTNKTALMDLLKSKWNI